MGRGNWDEEKVKVKGKWKFEEEGKGKGKWKFKEEGKGKGQKGKYKGGREIEKQE